MDRVARIVLATDELTLSQTLALTEKIGDRVIIKIHNLWDLHGPSVVQRLGGAGAQIIWVDLKLHDIPNTVRLRAEAVRKSGAHIVSVHAAGEIEMMLAALESGIMVYAITVPTSLCEEQAHLLHGQSSKAAVLYLARLAKLAGVHGVVCSPKEVGMLSKRPELRGLKFVTPGIRSMGQSTDDQQRVDTPTGAIKAGANLLVIGRRITESKDPIAEVENLETEIEQALQQGGTQT